MRSKLALAAVLALVFTPALPLTVNLDYDRDYDFSKVRTYQWIPSRVAELNPLIDQRIVNAVNYELANRGKRLVESDPDVYVTYYANAREELKLNDTDPIPPGWAWHSNYGSATQQVKTWRVGTLIIDALDAKTRKLVFRGTAEDTVKIDPDAIEKKINKALKKMGRMWDERLEAGR